MDEKKKPEKDQRKPYNRKRRDYPKDNRGDNRRDYRGYNRRDNRGDYRGDNRSGYRGDNRRPHGPRNIRYGTKFCGECRACKFWIEAKFGRYRCENSYLPFEILEFRRDGQDNITEVVLNLLV